MSTSASSRLTAAMTPRSRFVVSRFPAFIRRPSSVRRAWRGESRLRPGGVEFVDGANAVVRHFAELLDCLLESRNIAPQIVNGGLEPVTHVLTSVSKEEVTG